MDYFMAALKKRGIYAKLSSVFIIKPGELDRPHIPYLDEFEQSGSGETARYNPDHGALYVAEELQELLCNQFRALLTHTNPPTGMTYAEDPALAYVEIYKEFSALFGGLSRVMARFGAVYITAQSPSGAPGTDRGVLVVAVARARNRTCASSTMSTSPAQEPSESRARQTL